MILGLNVTKIDVNSEINVATIGINVAIVQGGKGDKGDTGNDVPFSMHSITATDNNTTEFELPDGILPDTFIIVFDGSLFTTNYVVGDGIITFNEAPLEENNVTIFYGNMNALEQYLVLGETITTAYRGDRGKIAYDHSQTTHAPSNAEQNVNADWDATSGDAQILHKPTIPSIEGLATEGYVAGYAEPKKGTDDNFVTDAEKARIGSYPDLRDETQNQILNDIGEFIGIPAGSGGGSNANLFFSNVNSEIEGVKVLNYIADVSETELSNTINSTDGNKLIGDFLYPTGLDETSYPAGNYSFNLYGRVSAITGDTFIGARYYKRSVAGVKTYIFPEIAWSNKLTNSGNDLMLINYTTSEIIVTDPTDRAGCELYLKRTQSTARTVYIIIGDGHASYLTNPNLLRHSRLRSINGDLAVQHLDSATEKETPINADSVGLWDSITGKFILTTIAHLVTFLSNTFLSKTTKITTENVESAVDLKHAAGSDNQDLSGFATKDQTTPQTIGSTGSRLAKLWATDVETTNMPIVGGIALDTTFAQKNNPIFTGIIHNTIPVYTSEVSISLDTIGDTRFQVVVGVRRFERCTLGNATKGGGTWVVDIDIDSAGQVNFKGAGSALSATFTGYIQGSGGGVLQIGQGAVPRVDNIFDLGQSNLHWRDLYLTRSLKFIDINILKNSTNGIEINNGTAGQYRDLMLRNLHQTEYTYNAVSPLLDTVNDIRTYNNAGVFTIQKCTVANATKGAGTWVTTFTA